MINTRPREEPPTPAFRAHVLNENSFVWILVRHLYQLSRWYKRRGLILRSTKLSWTGKCNDRRATHSCVASSLCTELDVTENLAYTTDKDSEEMPEVSCAPCFRMFVCSFTLWFIWDVLGCDRSASSQLVESPGHPSPATCNYPPHSSVRRYSGTYQDGTRLQEPHPSASAACWCMHPLYDNNSLCALLDQYSQSRARIFTSPLLFHMYFPRFFSEGVGILTLQFISRLD